MVRLAAMAVTFVTLGLDRARTRLREQDREAGVTLEQVLISVGMFILAGLLVTVITGAVQSRLSQIT